MKIKDPDKCHTCTTNTCQLRTFFMTSFVTREWQIQLSSIAIFFSDGKFQFYLGLFFPFRPVILVVKNSRTEVHHATHVVLIIQGKEYIESNHRVLIPNEKDRRKKSRKEAKLDQLGGVGHIFFVVLWFSWVYAFCFPPFLWFSLFLSLVFIGFHFFISFPPFQHMSSLLYTLYIFLYTRKFFIHV